MKLGRFILAIIIVAISLNLFKVQAQSTPISLSTDVQTESDAPYVQYLSRAHQGIVIERADGTDSHILGAGTIPYEHNAVHGPGWSDDGQWLAFYTGFEGIPQGEDWPEVFESKGYIYHISGRPSQAIQNFAYISFMHWLDRASHLLAVGGRLPIEVDGALQTESVLAIIDVEKDEIVDYTPFNTSYPAFAFGHNLAVIDYVWRPASDGEETEMLIVSSSGQLTKLPTFSLSEYQPLNDEQFLVRDLSGTYWVTGDGTRTDFWPNADYYSRLNTAVVYEDHVLVDMWDYLLDWQDGQVEQIGNAENPSFIANRTVVDGQILLNMPESGLVLYDINSGEITHIAEAGSEILWSNTQRYFVFKADERNLYLYDMEARDLFLLSTEGVFSRSFSDDISYSFAPDDSFLVFNTVQGFMLYELANRSEHLYRFDSIVDKQDASVEFVSSALQDIYWQDNAVLVKLSETYKQDTEQKVFTALYQIDLASFAISRSQQYLVYGDDQITVRWDADFYYTQYEMQTWHTETEEWTSMQPFGWNVPTRLVNVSEQNNWMILNTSAVPNVFQSKEYYVYERDTNSFTITDGFIFRDLTAQCDYGDCVTWLPENIDVTRIPLNNDGLETVAVFNHDDIIRAVAWSPDGSQFAVAWGDDILAKFDDSSQFLTIWEVATGDEIQTYPLEPNNSIGGMVWNEDGLFVGSLTVIGDYTIQVYKLVDDEFELIPLDFQDEVTPTDTTIFVLVYEHWYVHASAIGYLDEDTLVAEPYDYFTQPNYHYISSDGQASYKVEVVSEIEDITVTNVNSEESLGDYPTLPYLPYFPEKRLAVSENQIYVAVGGTTDPLTIYFETEVVGAFDAYPWVMSFHPTEENILAVGTSHRVEILRIPQD